MEYKGIKMLIVKNPWGESSWKGKWSVDDSNSWTPELKEKFAYHTLKEKDKGIFWIDWDSLCDNFDSLFINWNPDLL